MSCGEDRLAKLYSDLHGTDYCVCFTCHDKYADENNIHNFGVSPYAEYLSYERVLQKLSEF